MLRTIAGLTLTWLVFVGFAPAENAPFTFTTRSRIETAEGTGRYHIVHESRTVSPSQLAIIVCDMWDLHHSPNATRRGAELAPRMDQVLQQTRNRGTLIIHAPSSCMDAYKDHPARKRALAIPKAKRLPEGIQQWCRRIPAEEKVAYPIDQSDGGEDDDPAEHKAWAEMLAAMGRNPRAPWKSQTDLLSIDREKDLISDQGDEIWSALEQHGIENVILVGVHTNMCVLGRPFGLRQLAKHGKKVLLMRDLTDTMYNPQRAPYVSHFTGTDLIVEHIEKVVCPSIASDQIVGGKPFRFKGDVRPHLVVLAVEDEYQTERTLPKFALTQLGKEYQVSFLFADAKERHTLPSYPLIHEADALLISVRRRLLPAEQMDIMKKYMASGKPVIGIRTANHAFSLRPNEKPPADRVAWDRFDREVIGCHYTGHHPDTKKVTAVIEKSAEKHAVLTGVKESFESGGSLYRCNPLEAGATVLLTGKAEGVAEAEPVAWIWNRPGGGRVFYTSLGHPSDFENESFVRLLRNGIAWTLDK